ncbi:MAG: protein translocase subunit SecD [Syntrophobacterales bacterium]|jgi:preprotein translocase subunit SecD|nr:protein translocase subunit SecD [Syntrophobacterales bacterium]
MFRDIRVRVGIALIVTLGALYYLVPTLVPELPNSLKPYFPKDKVKLGLDLQGGMHLVLEVDTDKAVENTVERLANNLRETLMDKNVRFKNLERVKTAEIALEVPGKEAADDLGKVLSDLYPDLEVRSSEIVEGRERIFLKLKDKKIEDVKRFAVEQSLETIRNRIDQFGVAEPEIVPQGDDRIFIQLPGIKDPQRAINLIGKTALLEFKLVDEEHSLEEALRGNIPPGDVILYGFKDERGGGQRVKIPYLLKDKTVLTGESLEKAEVKISDRFSEPYIAIKFNSQGAKDFERITAENVKKRLAIILDGVVYSAPVIQERISGGNAQITGSFTLEEARDLAIVLRAGALPAPVRVLEQVTVGPSLGQDSIEKGIISTVVGFFLVVIFMIFYYRYSGIIADMALFLNVILTLGTLAIFKATLTLPGIAGILLTIGMAVDANVLIFERAREEMRLGKTPRAVIETGYGKAFITILDTHITTLIAALFLFQFGTGPVKGFAVTLTIGLIYSIFTAVFVTRIVFDYFIWNRKIKRISIGI